MKLFEIDSNAKQLRRVDKTTYNRIKDALLEAGMIVSGRGRGGSVALVE